MSCAEVGCVGDCSVACEFDSARRLRRRATARVAAGAPVQRPRPLSVAARVAAATGLPIGEVRAALQAGRTFEDLVRGAA